MLYNDKHKIMACILFFTGAVTITHNERYDKAQKEYLAIRSDEALNTLYIISRECASNYIRKYERVHHIRGLDIENMSQDAATFVISQYLYKPWWKVERISSYIHYGVLKIMLNPSQIRWDQTASYDEVIDKWDDENKAESHHQIKMLMSGEETNEKI